MRASTTVETKTTKTKKGGKAAAKSILSKAAVAVFWLFVWEIIYLIVDKEILIASPFDTLKRLCLLATTFEFWQVSAMSLLRIMEGFLCGVVVGTLLAVFTAKSKIAHLLFKPIISIARATPVASFIILALVWISKQQVPAFIAALMVFPIIWSNVFEGITGTDKKLLDMAKAFKVKKSRQLLYLYLPSVFPCFITGATSSLGLAWKAGIAAEVLSIPKNSIGTMLYNSKIYIETADLFAWTAVVIVLSMVLEKLFVMLIGKISVNIRVKQKLPVISAKDRKIVPAPSVRTTLSKTFGDLRVLKDFSLNIESAKVTAILGASGCGKTTLLNIISGIDTDDSGKSVYKDRLCAYVFQENRLIPQLSARENILFVNEHADVDELLKQMELSDFANSMPDELSGGMKRRLSIARALSCSKGLALLDEPFTGLDENLKEIISQRVFDMLSDNTVVLVTHDSAQAEKYADNTVGI